MKLREFIEELQRHLALDPDASVAVRLTPELDADYGEPEVKVREINGRRTVCLE